MSLARRDAADTANGECYGRRISRDDYSLPRTGVRKAVLDWAAPRRTDSRRWLRRWTDVGCHAGNLGEWAYDTSGLDSLVDVSGLDSALEWVDESIYQNLPGPLRTAWDFYYGFNVLGPARVVTGLFDGVGGVLTLGNTYVNNLIDDPWGTLQSTAEFVTNPVAQAEFAWNLGSAIVSDYAERCPSSATEAGACTFEVALEVVLAVTTGGAGTRLASDDLRYLALYDVDERQRGRVLENTRRPPTGARAREVPVLGAHPTPRRRRNRQRRPSNMATCGPYPGAHPQNGTLTPRPALATRPGFAKNARPTHPEVRGHAQNPNARGSTAPNVRRSLRSEPLRRPRETVLNSTAPPHRQATANDSHIRSTAVTSLSPPV